jgi:hypothetical protein
MSVLRKRTIDEINSLPACMEFLEKRYKLNDCFYCVIRDESVAKLCLMEGAIQANNIKITRFDTSNAIWFIFSSMYKKSFIVSSDEIKLIKKFFQILIDNQIKNLYSIIFDGLLDAIWFIDDKIVKCRLLQIIKTCILPVVSFLDCQKIVRSFEKEKKTLMGVRNMLQMEQTSFDCVIQLFQTKMALDIVYLLEKKLSYVCPSIVIMFSQLNF